LRLETIVAVVEADPLALGNRNVWRERRAELGGEELYAQRRLRAIINLSPRRRLIDGLDSLDLRVLLQVHTRKLGDWPEETNSSSGLLADWEEDRRCGLAGTRKLQISFGITTFAAILQKEVGPRSAKKRRQGENIFNFPAETIVLIF